MKKLADYPPYSEALRMKASAERQRSGLEEVVAALESEIPKLTARAAELALEVDFGDESPQAEFDTVHSSLAIMTEELAQAKAKLANANTLYLDRRVAKTLAEARSFVLAAAKPELRALKQRGFDALVELAKLVHTINLLHLELESQGVVFETNIFHSLSGDFGTEVASNGVLIHTKLSGILRIARSEGYNVPDADDAAMRSNGSSGAHALVSAMQAVSASERNRSRSLTHQLGDYVNTLEAAVSRALG